MAALIKLRKPCLIKRAHLENAEHLLLLVEEGEIVGEELDLEGIRELLYHLEIEQVEELRQETVLGLVHVYFKNCTWLSLFVCLILLFLI